MKKLSFVFLFVLLMLAGCGTAEIELNKDGSGEVKYELPYDDSLYSVKEIEEEFKNMVEEANDEAGEKVMSLKKIKEKDGVLTAQIKFENGTYLKDAENFVQVSVADMIRYNPSALEDLKDLDGKKIDLESKKVKDYTYLEFSDIDLEKMILTVPGEVKYVSNGVKLKDKKEDTIVTEKGAFIVVYEEKSGINFTGIIIGLVVLIALFFLFKKGVFNKFNRKNSQSQIESVQRLDGGTSQDA